MENNHLAETPKEKLLLEEITIDLTGISEKYAVKKHIAKKYVAKALETAIFFYCIIMSIFIMLWDGFIGLFKKLKPRRGKLRSPVQLNSNDIIEESSKGAISLFEEGEHRRVQKRKSFWDLFKKEKKENEGCQVIKERKFKLPFFLSPKTSLAYITASVFLVCGCMYAFFSDTIHAEVDMQAGTVLVKLDEKAPFNDLTSIPEEGANTNVKSFRAVSTCTIDTYVRARIIPTVEQYDEEEQCYVVIPIDVNDVNLSVNAPNWIYSNGYYYYKNILVSEAKSDYVDVTVTGIQNAGVYENTDVRVTLRVELEAAQVRNDLWKQIFNIESLPF